MLAVFHAPVHAVENGYRATLDPQVGHVQNRRSSLLHAPTIVLGQDRQGKTFMKGSVLTIYTESLRTHPSRHDKKIPCAIAACDLLRHESRRLARTHLSR